MSNTTRRITSIKPITLANTAALFYGVIGAVIALSLALKGIQGIPFCVGYTVGYALAAWVAGIIGAFLYNIVASKIGGIEVTIAE
jgi:uncharacterized membrane protein YeaQ/YmgE (transglycosylase-associated protein family)